MTGLHAHASAADMITPRPAMVTRAISRPGSVNHATSSRPFGQDDVAGGARLADCDPCTVSGPGGAARKDIGR